MTALRQPAGELRGWHVLTMLLLFFGVIIGVNVFMAFSAIRTFPGEDVTHPYIQGLEYNQTLAEHRAQAALGWGAVASLRRAESGGMLQVEMHDRANGALDGLALSGVLRWPADARRDRALAFHEVSPGVYAAPLAGLPRGDWQLRARAARGREALDFEADLTWPTAS